MACGGGAPVKSSIDWVFCRVLSNKDLKIRELGDAFWNLAVRRSEQVGECGHGAIVRRKAIIPCNSGQRICALESEVSENAGAGGS